MEINAQVYVLADSKDLLKSACKTLESQMGTSFYGGEDFMPNAVLPLKKAWYGFSASTGPTSRPEYGDGWWDDGLRKCAQLLKKRGAVVVSFWSPDHPDDYREYAYTTAQGGIDIGSSYSLYSYKRALGSDDVRLVFEELLSGRTQRQRDAAASRKAKQDKLRAEKGDFDIVKGVLKKYRGTDEEVTLPEGVTEIGEFAFVDKQGWRRMLLDDAGYDAPALETLVIPEGVRKIGTYALAYCLNMTEVTMPDSVTVIEERAFEGCELLESVVLPRGLKEIAAYTFFLCDGLESVTMPEGLEQIGADAFQGCVSLKQVTIPKSVVRIQKEAFYGCNHLTKINIPDSVRQMGPKAFAGCSKLSRIKLGHGLTHIADRAFKGCSGLKEIIIPESVVSIGESAFEDCRALEKVVLPRSLKRIGVKAFNGCQILREINMPNGLAEVGENAFDGCWKLGKMSFSPEVRRFSSDIFIDDVCASHAGLKDALMKIWNSRMRKPYWSDDSFKETVYALDVEAEVTFLDRSFILWAFDEEEEKRLKDEIVSRGGVVYSLKSDITPDYLVLCMGMEGSWMLEETLKKRERGESVSIISDYQLRQAFNTIPRMSAEALQALETDRNNKKELLRIQRQEAERQRAEQKRKAEEEQRIRKEEREARKLEKQRADEEKKRLKAEKALVRAEKERLAEEAKAQREQARQEAISNAVILYAPGEEPERLQMRLNALFEKLDSAYPDRRIFRLGQDHKEWGERVTELYRLLGYPDGQAFLEAYGYIVEKNAGGRKPTVDPMAIMEELHRRYPDGGVQSMARLKQENPDIPWKTLANNAKEYFGKTLTQHMKAEGIIQ